MPPTPRSPASRERILAGARTILDEGVYSDLTVDALARALKMSKSTLYKYFTGKDDLICCIISETCGETEQAIEAAHAGGGEPTSVLDRIIALLADHAIHMPRAAWLQQDRLPEPCQGRIATGRAHASAVLEAVFDAGRHGGEFTSNATGLTAVALLAAVDAAVVACARGENDLPRDEAVHRVYALFRPSVVRAAA